jgi:hypothetical protein
MEDTHRNSVIVPNRKTLSAQEKLELRQATPFVLQAVNANKNDSVNEYIPPDFLSNLDQPTKRLPIPTTELTTTIIPPEFEKSSNSMDSNP